MVESRMGGKPYQVGRFARDLRIRLMKEHVGLDVEGLDDLPSQPISTESIHSTETDEVWDPDSEIGISDPEKVTQKGHTAGWARSIASSAIENTGSVAGGVKEVIGLGLVKGTDRIGKVLEKVVDDTEGEENDAQRILEGKESMPGGGFASTVVPTLEENVMMGLEGSKVNDTRQIPLGSDQDITNSNSDEARSAIPAVETQNGKTTIQDSNPPSDIDSLSTRRPSQVNGNSNGNAANHNSITEGLRKNLKEDVKNPYSLPLLLPRSLKAEDLVDPLEFYETFMAVAVRNTQIYRK